MDLPGINAGEYEFKSRYDCRQLGYFCTWQKHPVPEITMDIIGYIVVPLLGFLFFTFPGVLLISTFKYLNTLSKITTGVFFSISFWVCLAWFLDLLHLPLRLSALSLMAVFILYFAIFRKGAQRALLVKARSLQLKNIPLHRIALVIAILSLIFPILFITIPPGNDTAMHGYISRLIIDNNGLPHSYRPILPVDYFGSYSAGYHVLTALISGVNSSFLRLAIIFLSISVYPLTLISMVFCLNRFFTEKTAIYTAIIFFGINHSYKDTIWWAATQLYYLLHCVYLALGCLCT